MYIKIVEDPKEVKNCKVKQVTNIPGEPVFYYAKSELLLPDEQIGMVLNGQTLDLEQAKQTIPNPEDYLVIVPLVAGGDNNQLLATIAMIVIMVYAPEFAGWASNMTGAAGVATAAATTWNFWGWAAYVGAMYVGGYLIPKWTAPKKDDVETSPTYGWDGIRALWGNNQPIPVTFGRVKTAGQIVSSYIDYDGENQYMNLLIEAGEGPCDYIGNGEDNNCTGITNIKIDGNAISNYSGVTVYKRAGLNNQSVIPNFGDTITEKQISYLLDKNVARVDTTSTNGNGLRIVLYWPGGLSNIHSDGDHEPLLEKILIEYKLESSSTWLTWEVYEIERDYTKAFWVTRRIDNIPEGTYNVRCTTIFQGRKVITTTWQGSTSYTTTTYVDGTSSRAIYEVYWTSLAAITYDDFVRPNKILLGIKALASDQLSGSFTVTFELIRSYVWVWNPDANQYQPKPANNPAWACYWMLHRAYYLQNIHTGAWQFAVRGVPTSRINYQEFANWAAFCTERELEINIIFDVKQKLEEALKTVCDLGRGMVLSRASKYGCVFDGPADKDDDGNIIPDQVYNMSNIILDSFSEQFIDVSDRSTAIEVTFRDRNNDFEQTTILVPADNLDESASLENITQVTWNGCTSYAQAWREAKYRLRLNQYLVCTGSWQANVEAIQSSIGQVVMLQHDVPAFGRGGRIISATENTITLDQSILTDIQGEVYYDPAKQYQILIWLNNDTHIYKNIQSVDETGTVITLTEPFNNDIDTSAVFVDATHFKTSNELAEFYTVGQIIQLIYSTIDYCATIANITNDPAAGKITVEVTDNPVIDDDFTVRYAWTMPHADDKFNLGEVNKHSKPFKIGSIQRTQDMQYTISGLEYIDALYTEATDIPDIEYSYLEPIFEVAALKIKEETFKSQKDGTRVSRLNCSWNIPIGKRADAYLVYFSIDNGTSWEYYETTPMPYTYIDNVRVGATYKVKIIVRKGMLNSKGVVSEGVTIIGKDIPPSDVESLSITQSGSELKFVVTLVPDPDIAYYEIRLGPTIDNSEVFLKIDSNEGVGTKEAPRTGNLTFWARAYDNSDLFSANAARRDIEVFGTIPKNFIWQESPDITTWVAQNMYFSPWREWKINSKEVIDDYDDILDMFADSGITMADNPQLTLPIIDLGEYVLQSECYYIDPWGEMHLKSVIVSDDYDDLLDFFATTNTDKVEAQYMMTTFLNPTITYNQGLNNRVDIYYRTRADGDQWTVWKDASEKQFTGRRIEPKIIPVSLDGITNVAISAATIEVDVPERSEIRTNLSVPVEGLHITYRNRYYFPPTASALRTTDLTGLEMPPQMVNEERDGCDIFIYDYSGNAIAGIIKFIEIWGY